MMATTHERVALVARLNPTPCAAVSLGRPVSPTAAAILAMEAPRPIYVAVGMGAPAGRAGKQGGGDSGVVSPTKGCFTKTSWPNSLKQLCDQILSFPVVRVAICGVLQSLGGFVFWVLKSHTCTTISGKLQAINSVDDSWLHFILHFTLSIRIARHGNAITGRDGARDAC